MYNINNKTIRQIYLDNCSINDEQVKILAEMFRLNKTITKLSLINNKITNAGIKTLLQIKGNDTLEVVISCAGTEVNIFDDNSIKIYSEKTQNENKLDVKSQIKTCRLRKKNPEENRSSKDLLDMNKNATDLLKLIAESHNEITKTGNIIKKLIAMVGMNGVGTTAFSCFLSRQKLEEDEERSLYAKEPEYNEKIHNKADKGYKLVNNFFISDDEGGINIIECPGIHIKT
ncbi:MAG: hypothetical protein O7C59_01710 [Rickettsia endosymbiont of Ixodes persulcatus]|nr:hypothetical protein [Rickettsia endosymbiont of Ixodes persulcatus]MCZ6903067.1 hypothetical protein [Rickettsia endosymbiont of Ixodes persulcatus]MCZ6908606.1 hypothetical protein [Rickettsia endosymbiont of Ixodes persulcatus]MCZ6913343.1 hypothetical protein [Rickettsia endosymbiont of Ixodes persulcatus]MCZ6919214.1 hypothetical protein [Rickettsia endosymbiont of Ixodes persulcatus]